MNPLYIVFGCIGAAVILIVVLIILSTKRKKKEALLRVAEDKLREANLVQQILNPNAAPDPSRNVSEKPYEMRYSTAAAASATRSGIMLQIEEISEISKRKYMVNPVPAITIGSGTGNSIVLTDMTIESKQCELGLTENNQVYVKNLGTTDLVSVLRGKKSIPVGGEAVVLKKSDQLKIGGVKLTINILKVA